MCPGEWYGREVAMLIDEYRDAYSKHDRNLSENGCAHGSRREFDAAYGQPDCASRQQETERTPGGMPRGVMGEGQRQHPSRHGEDSSHGDRVPNGNQYSGRDACSRSQRGLHVGDEAPRRRLGLGELGHSEGKKDDGNAGNKNREWCGDSRRDGDDAECKIEVDARSDVRYGRGRNVSGAKLTGSQVVSGLTHSSPMAFRRRSRPHHRPSLSPWPQQLATHGERNCRTR